MIKKRLKVQEMKSDLVWCKLFCQQAVGCIGDGRAEDNLSISLYTPACPTALCPNTQHTQTKYLEEIEKSIYKFLVSLAQSDHAITAEPANLTEIGLMMIASGASARQHRIFVCKVSGNQKRNLQATLRRNFSSNPDLCLASFSPYWKESAVCVEQQSSLVGLTRDKVIT